MVKTEASKTATGNWLLKAICINGHVVFKDQMHPNGPYRCPNCGSDVN